MRFFYYVDGSRKRVSNAEYKRLKNIQAGQIRRYGNKVWTDRRGRQYSVTPEEFKRRTVKRETARRASRIGWDAVREQRSSAKTEPVRGRRVYPGPSMDRVTTRAMWGKFRAMLFDYALSAIALDGRDPLLVEAVITSRIHTPEEEGYAGIDGPVEVFGGYEPPIRTPVCIMDYRNGKIRKGDEAELAILWSALSSGVEGLQIGSPKGNVRAKEQQTIEANIQAIEIVPEDGAVADPGYWMDLTSEIHLISPSKGRSSCE